MREPASITGRKKKNLLYKSFADHKLPFIEFDCGDKKQLIFVMQRGKNWFRDGFPSKKIKERKKKVPLPVFFKTLFYFFAVCIAFG